jgi:hypothetical protein
MVHGATFYGCLVTDEGTLCIPLRWGAAGEGCPWRFLPVQMWDTQGNPLAQPYETSAEYDGEPVPPDMWLVDLTNVPPGFCLVTLSAADWEKTQHGAVAYRYNAATAALELREEYEQVGNRVVLKARGTQEIAYTVRGGIPLFVDKASARVLLPTGLELFAAALADAAWLARAQEEKP